MTFDLIFIERKLSSYLSEDMSLNLHKKSNQKFDIKSSKINKATK